MNKKLTRRKFIKNVTAAGAGMMAAPYIVPSSVLGKNAPSNRINIGMIGTGRQAINVNLSQFLKMDQCRVVAVNDVDRWRMEQAASKVNEQYSTTNGVISYYDYRKLLDNPDIDAVMVSTPDHWHMPQGIASAMARKHISMEKALSVCINHSQALVDAVNRFSVHNRVDSEFRSIPKFSKAVGLVRGNKIGRIKKVVVGVPAPLSGSAPEPQPTMKVPEELDYDMWLGPAFPAPYTAKRVHERQNYNVRPGWMRIDDYCNGMITNWGAHLIDIALWGLDKEMESPISIEGTGEFTQSLWNTIEAFNLTYQFKDGTTLEYLIDNPYVKFIGENDDWIKVPFGDKPAEASNNSLLKGNVDEQYRNVPSDKEDFINSITENRPSMEPLEVGHNVYRLTNMGMIAAKLGRKLQWDKEKNDFVNDNAASSMLYRSVREKYLPNGVAEWMKKYGFSQTQT